MAASREQPEGPFTSITQQVIQLIVERIPRPEEVMMMENEDGEIVRVETRDTDGIALYKVMKDTLVVLATMDYEITEAILMNALDIQVRIIIIITIIIIIIITIIIIIITIIIIIITIIIIIITIIIIHHHHHSPSLSSSFLTSR